MGRHTEWLNRGLPRRVRGGSIPYLPVLCTLAGVALFLAIGHTQSFLEDSGRLSAGGPAAIAAVQTSGALLLFVLRRIFIRLCKRRSVKTKGFLLWRMAEYAAAAALFCGVLPLFSRCFPEAYGLYLKSSAAFAVMLLIFDTAACLAAEHIRREEEAGLMYLSGGTDRKKDIRLTDRKIDFADDSGVIRLSVRSESVLFIKSEGNYISLRREDGGVEKTDLIRMTLSSAENCLEGTPLIRCQRSYIVNTRRIRMMQNEARASFIILDDSNATIIPLSANYVERVTAAAL